MIDLSTALTDPEMGYGPFTVKRTTYRRRNGDSVPTEQTVSAMGCIHPGTPEMVRLLPEEERKETFIVIYTDFALSTGENGGGTTYTVPDRIEWNGGVWRVVKVRDWAAFGYYMGMAVMMHE